LPPIANARDAAGISAAVAAAVSNGDITLSEAAEVAKLIDSYVRARNAAELDDRMAIRQVSDEELMRIIMNAQATEAVRGQPTQRLLALKQR
jgi:microcompartment protein CcmL/EutN